MNGSNFKSRNIETCTLAVYLALAFFDVSRCNKTSNHFGGGVYYWDIFMFMLPSENSTVISLRINSIISWTQPYFIRQLYKDSWNEGVSPAVLTWVIQVHAHTLTQSWVLKLWLNHTEASTTRYFSPCLTGMAKCWCRWGVYGWLADVIHWQNNHIY